MKKTDEEIASDTIREMMSLGLCVRFGKMCRTHGLPLDDNGRCSNKGLKQESINLNHPGFQDSVGELGYEQAQGRKLFVTLKTLNVMDNERIFNKEEAIERILNSFLGFINEGVINRNRGIETIKDILYDIELQHRAGVP